MNQNKEQQYAELAAQAEALVSSETDMIANMANISSLIYWALADVNWAGFYLHKEEQLVLGPFHGQPACIRIPLGRGVCGTAAQDNQIQLIEDVHEFAGHISCDAASNSEIVLPILKDGKVFGVLDLDSPLVARFDEQDKVGLSKIVEIFEKSLNLEEGK
ncbi:GAF domain-containing protein [Paraglaciecola marina]|uniref:GAF domain-containing protein n=1 Tax=Paraglaciecola marina TaxID=2500157 RepID=UPI00105F0F8C|nr:GAF domain-containing protein [Paraglaciecola marina]